MVVAAAGAIATPAPAVAATVSVLGEAQLREALAVLKAQCWRRSGSSSDCRPAKTCRIVHACPTILSKLDMILYDHCALAEQ
jgi:hypothetical protein